MEIMQELKASCITLAEEQPEELVKSQISQESQNSKSKTPVFNRSLATDQILESNGGIDN